MESWEYEELHFGKVCPLPQRAISHFSASTRRRYLHLLWDVAVAPTQFVHMQCSEQSV